MIKKWLRVGNDTQPENFSVFKVKYVKNSLFLLVKPLQRVLFLYFQEGVVFAVAV